MVINDYVYKNSILFSNGKQKVSTSYYGYDSLSETMNEILNQYGKEYHIVPLAQWEIDDFANACGNDLEDKNYHSLTELPDSIANILRKYLQGSNLANCGKEIFNQF